MSILIKGITMPKNCIECPFMALANTTDGRLLEFCSVSEMFVVGIETQKDPKCPLVELPPHGRLIDADELYTIYADLLDGGDVKPVVPKSVIDTSSTIIEAEETI